MILNICQKNNISAINMLQINSFYFSFIYILHCAYKSNVVKPMNVCLIFQNTILINSDCGRHKKLAFHWEISITVSSQIMGSRYFAIMNKCNSKSICLRSQSISMFFNSKFYSRKSENLIGKHILDSYFVIKWKLMFYPLFCLSCNCQQPNTSCKASSQPVLIQNYYQHCKVISTSPHPDTIHPFNLSVHIQLTMLHPSQTCYFLKMHMLRISRHS